MRKFLFAAFAIWLGCSTAISQQIGGGSGTVTSIATSCGVSGGPITTTGTISAQVVSATQSGPNYAFQSTDCGSLVNLDNASPQIPTLPQAGSAGFEAGWFTSSCNIGAGTQTITPTTSTIGGAATFVLAGGSAAAPLCVGIVSDGTNYLVVPAFTTNASVLTSGTLAAARMPALTGDCVSSAGSSVLDCSMPGPLYIASNWYLPYGTGNLAATTALAANIIRCHAAIMPQKVTVGALGIRISTAGTNASLAIYASSSGRPGAKIGETAPIDVSGAAGAKTGSLLANKQIGPGGADGGRTVWLCYNGDNASTVSSGPSVAAGWQAGLIGSSSAAQILTASTPIIGVTCTGAACAGGSSTFPTSGNWPATLAGTTWSDISGSGSIPAIGWQAASVP